MGDSVPKLVLVDDDDSTRQGTLELLQGAGYDAVGVATTLGLRKAVSPQCTVLCDVSPPRTFHQIVEMAQAVRAIAGERTSIVLYGSQPAVQLSILVRACAAAGFVERSRDPDVVLSRLARLCALPAPQPRGSIKLLLIDDDELTLEVMQARLRVGGYDVRIALSLGEVQSIIRGWQPAAIVADVNMPDMRGDDLCSRLKAAAATRDAIVVLCSSLPDAELEQVARAAGADGWVSKDKGVERIVSSLQTALGHANGSKNA
jgi:CheY-like chemotaxis protein